MSKDYSYISIENENGIEEMFKVIYEFDNDKTGYTYLLLTKDFEEEMADDEDTTEIYALKYKTAEVLEDKEPNFELVESDEEWQEIENVIKSFEEDKGED